MNRMVWYGLLALVVCASCNGNITTGSSSGRDTLSGTISGFISDSDAVAGASYTGSLYTPSSFVSDSTTFGTTLAYDLSSDTVSSDALTGNTSVTLKGTTSSSVTIDNGGHDLLLTLNGVSISNKLTIKGKGTTFVVLEGTNALTASTKPLNSVGDLVVQGAGSLSVTTDKNGITSDDVICIQSGTIAVTVTTAGTDKGTCIKPVNGFIMNGGTVTLNGNNATEGCESKGIKVDGTDDATATFTGGGLGYVIINGGALTVTTQGKAISAGWDVDDDATTTDTSDDPSPDLIVNGGLITITTKASPREDVTDQSGNVTSEGVSPEGLEAKNNLTINGGKIVVNSTDDAINAGNTLTINGGLIFAYGSANDGVDAGAEENEGYLVINGGTVVALGSSAPETGLDSNGDSRFTYTGGTVIGLGGASNNVPGNSASASGKYYVTSSGTFSSAASIAVVDSSNALLCAFAPPSGYSGSSLFFASSSLTSSCAVGTGATVSSSENTFEGLSFGSVATSGGSWSDKSAVSAGTSSSGGGGGSGGGGR